jgi:hypothetical protein
MYFVNKADLQEVSVSGAKQIWVSTEPGSPPDSPEQSREEILVKKEEDPRLLEILGRLTKIASIWKHSSSVDKRRHSVVDFHDQVICESGPDDIRPKGHFEIFEFIANCPSDVAYLLGKLGYLNPTDLHAAMFKQSD